MKIRKPFEYRPQTRLKHDIQHAFILLLGAILSMVFVAYAQNAFAGAFIRGDANQDGAVDISDPIAIIGALYYGQGELLCDDAADANDDGYLDISDVSYLYGFLFRGGEEPPAPFMDLGYDPTEDHLQCAEGVELAEPDADILADSCEQALPCAGSFRVENSSDLEEVAQCQSISGSLRIQYVNLDTSVDLPCLETVGGDLRIWNNGALERVEMPNLISVGGNLIIGYNDVLEDLHGLSGLQSLGNHLYIERNTLLHSISGLLGIEVLIGDLRVSWNRSLCTLSIKELADEIVPSHLRYRAGKVVIWDNQRNSGASCPSSF